MSEPVPGPQEERPEPVVRKPGRPGMVAALLCLAAAAVAMVAMFQDLVVAENLGAGSQRFTTTITLWDARFEINGVVEPQPDNDVPVNGVPVMLAVALLLAAALLGTLARVRRIGGLVTVAAAAFLTAVVIVVGMQGLWWLQIFEPPNGGQEGVTPAFSGSFASGFWTLAAAAVLAVAATVPTWRRPRAEQERVEPDTPRLGTPLVVRLPDEPQNPTHPM